jgi:chaperonin GroEL (HSP60 family)
MIKDSRGEILITNDGATILQKMDVVHPTAKMVYSIINLVS